MGDFFIQACCKCFLFVLFLNKLYLCVLNFTAMTTLTLNINEKTEKGKALLAFLKAFYEEKEVVQLVEEPKSPYNKAFVKKINEARKEIKEGKTIAIETDSIWESIE